MKKPNHKRQISAISNSRWATYAAAGAATTLACAHSAEAEIHYSGQLLVKLAGNAQASLPLSGGASLLFENFGTGTFYQQAGFFLMKGVVSGSARGYFDGANGHNLLSNLRSQRSVAARTFLSVTGNPGLGVLFSFTQGGFIPSFHGVRGFVGFRFNIGSGSQYGWARIQSERDRHGRIRYIVQDYAWGDVGDRILTGQKKSLQEADANSVFGSLGLLAFGSQGLEAWRAGRAQNFN